ncbi:MAG: hypothetical protein HXX18_11960 [Bacteroidetes bacterium]|nr:hypothetical protein [Bacteroidota bacterium]
MKKTIFSIVFLLLTIVLFAQKPISKGQTQLNAGIGLSGWGMPVYLGLDYGVHPDISVGGELSYRSYSENWVGVKYNHSVIGIIGNGNYHFNRIMNIPSPWDFYAGLNLGFYIINSPSNYGGGSSSGLGLGAQIGGRYYFNAKWGVNLELGGGNSVSGGKFGITYKF